MARMFVIMLIVHVALISGIILYDFMGDEETPQQTVTQAARAMSTTTGLPQAAPEVVNAQAQAAADTQEFDNYEMRSGDSLKSIAAKFGTTEEDITKLNLIDKGLQIGPGTMLRVPKQAVPSAIPIDPKTLKPMVAKEDVPKAVPVQDQPPVTKVPSETVAPLPPPSNPRVVSLLKENAPTTSKPKEEPKPVAKAEPKPLVKPNPVPPPSQMLKKIADKPPATKKAEPAKKTTDTPPKTVVKATPARSHTLQSGETLYRLASKFGVSVAAIQKANNIKNPNAMREGMKLVIPAK
jgi:LysM repeat protein